MVNVAMQLERIGVACEVAENGQEAFEMWLQQPFSLVLTDCHMPVMDGHQLAQAIRAEEAKTPERMPVPIIACTANIGQEEADRAIAAGMNQVLTKPIGLNALRAMLNTWLGSQEAAEGTAKPTPPALVEQIIDRTTLEVYSQGDLAIELGILQDFMHSEQEDMSTVAWTLMRPVLENHYRLLCLDFLGQGQSDKPIVDSYALTEQAELANALMVQLGIEQVYLAGLSYGGMVAQHFARRYQHKVEKLILASTLAWSDAVNDAMCDSWIAAEASGGLDLRYTISIPWLFSSRFLATHVSSWTRLGLGGHRPLHQRLILKRAAG